MKPIAFKVRGGGNYSGTKGGAVRPNEKGGAGYLGYEDKTFTIATSPDQWICTPLINSSPQPNPMNEPAQPAPVGRPIRYLSVCSGMEAASVAWHPLGWTPVGFSEIEPFPCAILKHRFPNTTNYGSLTEYTSWPLEPGAIDLLVGGTPCQSFSVAGLRKGLTDPRGNLALTFLGLADKLKPKYIIWENVAGVLSSNGGRDFGSFLGALVELGYGFAYRILDAQHFGVPQRRRRVFVVACLGDWRAAAEVLSLREGLRGYLETGNKKRKSPAADAGASPAAGCWWDGGQVSQTLDAVLAKGQTMPEKNRFPAVLTPVVIDRAAFNQGQNAQYEPHIVQASELRLRGQITEQDTCPTLLANTKSGDNDPLAIHAVSFQPGNLRRKAGADPSTTTTTTLKASAGDQTPHVAIAFDGYNQTLSNTSQTIRADKSDCDHVGMILTPMAVRRLTPIECERLQGFPDNWSRISWKGKPEEQCPDGPRYKACGNSMAVPVMRWIGERIAAVDATLSQPK